MFYKESINVRKKVTPKKLLTLQGRSIAADCVAISQSGKWVLSGDRDKTVRLFDDSGKERFAFRGHTREVTGVAISPDGNLALSGSDDNTVLLWDCQTGKQLYCLRLGLPTVQ